MPASTTAAVSALTWRSAVAVFAIVLLATMTQLHLVEGVTCHDCNTLTDAGSCSTAAASRTCNGTMCHYFVGKANGNTSVTIRECNSSTNFTGCGQTESRDSAGRQLSGISCYCNSSDFCVSPAEAPPIPVTQPPLPWGWLSTPFGAAFVSPSSDFTCYRCNSLQNSFCNEDLDLREHYESCPGAACLTYAGTVDGVYVVIRDCALYVSPALDECLTESGELDGHAFSGLFCHCKSNYCNTDIKVPSAFQANSESAACPTSAAALSLSLVAVILASVNICSPVAIFFSFS